MSQGCEFFRLGFIAHVGTARLFAFPAQGAARRGEWNDLAAVLDWLWIADCSCHQINPYFAGWRAEPHKLSLFALLISAVREFMNHLSPHCRRRGPPRP
jgi:hypothetical protein